MSLSDFVVTYFTDHLTLSTLIFLYSTAGLLYLVFRSDRDKPRVRSRVLVSIFAILTASWSFVASSLLLCQALLGLYEVDGLAAVKTVFGLGLLTSLGLALPLSLFVTVELPSVISRKLSRELSEPNDTVLSILRRKAQELGLFAVRLIQAPSDLPFAYSVGGRESMIVISEGLVEHFDPDELEAVITHELAHVKNNDTELSTIMAVYRKVLFFDPLMRLIEPAVHREREFLADELSARETRKPLALASALIKLHSAYSGKLPAHMPGLSLVGRANFPRVRILEKRIQRLLRIAQELEDEVKVFENSKKMEEENGASHVFERKENLLYAEKKKADRSLGRNGWDFWVSGSGTGTGQSYTSGRQAS